MERFFLLLKISELAPLSDCVLSLIPRPVRTGSDISNGLRLGVYHVSATSDKGWAVA